ncbi:carbohydrate kinase [Acidihalobacter aeolianus]|uniref:Carbohydrate kinase n=1 Tax=Acidihalobacter aeolianus TaxID=2792603 RepID=A0A1D8K721_9GAMM|nr:FGGY-family carbohydrate kinase [Acidihalobacter aeolianus]AOV16738.1 carbohydrate kinase [Acidihalobacter aeolianus]
MPDVLAIGVDVGTSGIRAVAIDAHAETHAEAALPLPAPESPMAGWQEQAPALWRDTLFAVLHRLVQDIPRGYVPRSLALDGTSGSLLLTNASGTPLGPALMYADRRATAEAARIATAAPATSGAHGASSALAKLLWLMRHRPAADGFRTMHQADWLLVQLGAAPGTSDENNALKLGYDPVERRWPDWLETLGVPPTALPSAHVPGARVGTIGRQTAAALGLPADLALVAGTTDSMAAFIATGAREPGEAVTSLGSTLVLKLLCRQPAFAPEYGIYSHRLGDLWLAGGASNSGGAVLRAHFTDEEIARCTDALHPDAPTGLDYYPLPTPGERFPFAAPNLQPRLTPRPDDLCRYFQGMLEGMAEIEQLGYAHLQRLAGETLRSVRSVGGGSVNVGWTRIRGTRLGVPMLNPTHREAAHGTALLALKAVA